MAQGPPTPPPTTETEIQDQARVAVENLPTASAPTMPSTTQLDVFQTAFPAIVDLASRSNFQNLIQVAENANLQVCDLVLLSHSLLTFEIRERC